MASMVAFLAVAVAILAASLLLLSRRRTHLPPGPRGFPLLGNLLQMRSVLGSPMNLQNLARQHGAIMTLRVGSVPLVVISSSQLAHEALIEKGSIFSSRPSLSERQVRLSNYRRSINAAPYGHHWRTVRRNMVSHVLSPHRVHAFEPARQRVISELVEKLRQTSQRADSPDGPSYRTVDKEYSADSPVYRAVDKECRADSSAVPVLATLRFTVFSLLSYMCFGQWLDKDAVNGVERMLRHLITSAGRGGRMSDFVPLLKIVQRSPRDLKLEELVGERRELLLPLIQRAKLLAAEDKLDQNSYLSSLFSLQRQEDHQLKLTDEDLIVLCSEFLNAGADTTANTLEWSLANVIKHPAVQKKLLEEIHSSVGDKPVTEKDIDKLVYLKAVVKETLRKHPPGYTTLPHAVTEPCKLGGYDIPVHATLLFNIYAINNDPELWTNPDEYKPERFLEGPGASADFTASSGALNLIPFGAGRRICPGLGLATLHVHLVLARLVQEFEWNTVPGETAVDLTPIQEFTVVMKQPLRATLKARRL
ncbi:cytochrome P450 77A1 [Selaginella moellendorffii]|uniref:cytochrome P450 77A1 n=1 Tax=Selaginella moellendorffii TaxID=88036 RepID=UPI000D1C5726|nr:cytochrome P450 77A1 [Selaginella moellendorffii]|eukprot:XP_024530814.1 cytochrome P450 77A1 [Selaginella moellendorffii]